MKLSMFISSKPHQKLALPKPVTKFFCSSATKHYEEGKHHLLYQRISPVGDPNASMIPILDQYVNEGKKVDKPQLIFIIKELKKYRRFKHALQVSEWMSTKTYFEMSPFDAALRITSLYRVHGLEQVENYFSNLSQQIKTYPVYVSLLNCYAQERCVEKAEALMQTIKDLGYVRSPVYHKIMMNLYSQIRNWAKVDDLMNEINEAGFDIDKTVLTIRMSAYAAASDAQGVEKIVLMLESDPKIKLDTITFFVAADACFKVGLVEKSLQMAKKIEKLTKSTKAKHEAYNALLHFYSKVGKKKEFLHIWGLYKKQKIFNKGYLSMMRGLMTFEDIEGMENILKEWESKKLSFDFRIADFLIEVYCGLGHPEKAEILLEKGISRGGEPFTTTWYHLAGGYIITNQVPKAVEALRKAISICLPDCPISKNNLSKCVEYLERGESNKAEELRSFLEKEGLFSATVRNKLFEFLSSKENSS